MQNTRGILPVWLSNIRFFKGTEIGEICAEILEKWQTLKPEATLPTQASNEELNEKLAKLLESQSLATTKAKQYTDEEKKIR